MRSRLLLNHFMQIVAKQYRCVHLTFCAKSRVRLPSGLAAQSGRASIVYWRGYDIPFAISPARSLHQKGIRNFLSVISGDYVTTQFQKKLPHTLSSKCNPVHLINMGFFPIGAAESRQRARYWRCFLRASVLFRFFEEAWTDKSTHSLGLTCN